MQTLTRGAYRATLSPTRNMGEFSAQLAKCTGKHKRATLRADSRKYPVYFVGQSTAEYVSAYHVLNYMLPFKDCNGFFAPLNTEPAAVYEGEDSHETVEDDSINAFAAAIIAQGMRKVASGDYIVEDTPDDLASVEVYHIPVFCVVDNQPQA